MEDGKGFEKISMRYNERIFVSVKKIQSQEDNHNSNYKKIVRLLLCI